ncbi:hypothetical protein J1605_018990 [Eschrichtius robustus]|uniref:Uncharacterized protein n=1 Tax=Eschrichtius robustus TaxID=9764 RepID=A0AB34HNT8_ESCRO|nr:hypothetical protein J1605_018990 [Eschrichtius robustus]
MRIRPPVAGPKGDSTSCPPALPPRRRNNSSPGGGAGRGRGRSCRRERWGHPSRRRLCHAPLTGRAGVFVTRRRRLRTQREGKQASEGLGLPQPRDPRPTTPSRRARARSSPGLGLPGAGSNPRAHPSRPSDSVPSAAGPGLAGAAGGAGMLGGCSRAQRRGW